jgi:hypothetical protein
VPSSKASLTPRSVPSKSFLFETQPGLAMNKGRCGTLTHDYSAGITTLFAALNVLAGQVIAAHSRVSLRSEVIRGG